MANIVSIKDCDTANGNGIRVSIFFSGCRRHCKGCFNSSTWDFNQGTPVNDTFICNILDKCDRPYINGLSILGGEPLDPVNTPAVEQIIKAFRDRFGYSKDIWLWTGNQLEDVLHYGFIRDLDVIIDGEFIEAKKDLTLKYRGSSNQRVNYIERKGNL